MAALKSSAVLVPFSVFATTVPPLAATLIAVGAVGATVSMLTVKPVLRADSLPALSVRL